MQTEGIHLNKKLHNPYGDCVRLDLQSHLVSGSEVRIHLDADFSHMSEDSRTKKYWLYTQGWRVKFGIRSGDLRFQLAGMSSPPSARRFRVGLPIGDTVEVSGGEERTESQEIIQDFSFAGKASGEPISIGLKYSGGRQLSRKAHSAHKYQKARVIVQASGNEDTPKWSFDLSTPDGILQGSLACPLADLAIKEFPCKLSARFMISINDIVICDLNEIAYFECSREKKFLIERRLQKYLAKKCGEQLSQVEISYER